MNSSRVMRRPLSAGPIRRAAGAVTVAIKSPLPKHTSHDTMITKGARGIIVVILARALAGGWRSVWDPAVRDRARPSKFVAELAGSSDFASSYGARIGSKPARDESLRHGGLSYVIRKFRSRKGVTQMTHVTQVSERAFSAGSRRAWRQPTVASSGASSRALRRVYRVGIVTVNREP